MALCDWQDTLVPVLTTGVTLRPCRLSHRCTFSPTDHLAHHPSITSRRYDPSPWCKCFLESLVLLEAEDQPLTLSLWRGFGFISVSAFWLHLEDLVPSTMSPWAFSPDPCEVITPWMTGHLEPWGCLGTQVLRPSLLSQPWNHIIRRKT